MSRTPRSWSPTSPVAEHSEAETPVEKRVPRDVPDVGSVTLFCALRRGAQPPFRSRPESQAAEMCSSRARGAFDHLTRFGNPQHKHAPIIAAELHLGDGLVDVEGLIHVSGSDYLRLPPGWGSFLQPHA